MPIPIQKGRLGRGLASLIGEASPGEARISPQGEQRLLSIDQLHPSGRNPRRAFGDIELIELADSIRQKGLLQPIIARPDRERGGFEIVAGERRWRAAPKALLHTVPVILRELSDQEAAEFALIENVQRTDLNPIEEATGYSELIDKYGYTQEQVAEVIGKSRSHLANTLRLLRLPASVQALVQDGHLTSGHARALIGRDDAEALARRIVEENLNVRAVEALVQAEARGDGAQSPRRHGNEKDADARAFEKDLSDSLGLKVEIKPGSGESGTLSIKYGNFDQLDYIRTRLIGAAEA
ncbi:MAG TPA: ParB/RepB/Spo0J family partition protein [Hyphomicrobiaceae bacterium]|nr:ParB/RepB/Spo0J family partition protein [Hyphomicrobiaceae bacterium]